MVVDPAFPPTAKSERAAKTFDLNKVLAALASAYPDNFVGALSDWKEQVQEHVSGDDILFVTPKSRLHAKTVRKGVMRSSWQ